MIWRRVCVGSLSGGKRGYITISDFAIQWTHLDSLQSLDTSLGLLLFQNNERPAVFVCKCGLERELIVLIENQWQKGKTCWHWRAIQIKAISFEKCLGDYIKNRVATAKYHRLVMPLDVNDGTRSQEASSKKQ